MNTAAVRRIVWKECRSQFSLWVALVFGAFVLQATILATQGIHAQGLGFVAATATVLTACFGVASLGMLFAGETEEGTREWLQMLPVRPRILVGSKLAFAVVSIALFFAATWGTGMLATAVNGRPALDLFRADYSKVTVRFPSILGIAAWGLLYSIRCRRVFHVLLLAVVTEILVVILTADVIPEYLGDVFGFDRIGGGVFEVLYFGVTGCVLIAAIALAVRWARAGGGSGAATRRKRISADSSLSWGGARERTWLRLAAWAGRRGSPAARETAVLAWRELRGTAPFAAVWLAIGLFAAYVLPLIVWSAEMARLRPFQALYLVATPVVCGLQTCLGDQRQQMFRFLGERGASPARVWWVKQSAWLLAAIGLTLACIRWDEPVPQYRPHATFENSSLYLQAMSAVRVPGWTQLVGDRAAINPQDKALWRWFVPSLLLSLFAAGQCASFWIRRPILAFGLMVVAAPLLVGWHFLLVAMDVPLWLGSWPLTLTLLAATLGSMSAWLRGRDSWMLRFTRLGAIVLPVIAVLAAAAAHRAFAVPAPEFSPDVASELRARETTFDGYDAAWSDRWRRALAGFRWNGERILTWSIPPERRPAVRQSLLELARELPTDPGRLDPLLYSPDSGLIVPWVSEFLINPNPVNDDVVADASTEPLDELWQRYEAGLRITAYLSQVCQSSGQYQACLQARGPLLHAIRDWAARPDQSPELLQQAFDVLIQDLQAPLQPRAMVVNRYVFYSQLLEHRGRKWSAIRSMIQDQRGFNTNNLTLVGAAMPGFERQRTLRLLGHWTEELLSRPDGSMASMSLQPQQLIRWAATSGGMMDNFAAELHLGAFADLRQDPNTVDGALLELRAHETATALVVALQKHALVEGDFPESLGDAVPPEAVYLVIDPYTDAPFGYKPDGFPEEVQGEETVLAAGQPLLWSAGHTRGWILPPTRPPGGGSPFANNRYEAAEPARIMLINAGAGKW